MKLSPLARLFLLFALLLLCAFLSLGLGGLSFSQFMDGLLNPSSTQPASLIVWQLRLPRVLLAIAGGASLALAGAGLQAILLNPLAEPFLLGVSSAACLGAALAIVLGFTFTPWSQAPLVLNALIMSCLAASFIYALARLKGAGPRTIILAGLAINFIFSAIVASLQFLAQDAQLRDLMFWMMGSLQMSASYDTVLAVGLSCLLGFAGLISQAGNLNALAAGAETAHSLGVNANRVNLFTLLLTCLLAAVAVAFMGAIGFVGLLAPHLARALWGGDHRYLLPAAALTGAFLLLTADTLARLLLWPLDVPVGIMTALLGGPFLLFLLLKASPGHEDE